MRCAWPCWAGSAACAHPTLPAPFTAGAGTGSPHPRHLQPGCVRPSVRPSIHRGSSQSHGDEQKPRRGGRSGASHGPSFSPGRVAAALPGEVQSIQTLERLLLGQTWPLQEGRPHRSWETKCLCTQQRSSTGPPSPTTRVPARRRQRNWGCVGVRLPAESMLTAWGVYSRVGEGRGTRGPTAGRVQVHGLGACLSGGKQGEVNGGGRGSGYRQSSSSWLKSLFESRELGGGEMAGDGGQLPAEFKFMA